MAAARGRADPLETRPVVTVMSEKICAVQWPSGEVREGPLLSSPTGSNGSRATVECNAIPRDSTKQAVEWSNLLLSLQFCEEFF